MRNILLFGAGRSASYLIHYLLNKSTPENLHITIADLSLESALAKTNNHPNATAISLDILNETQRRPEILKADIVISMLPANLHIEIAKDSLLFKKNLVTASYISEEMQKLDLEVKTNKLIFMNEIGLDPGIDHMSAMKVIDGIKNKGGKMISFESHCGGLVAPESENNLWNYKFTWAPKNVVLAGQGGTAKYLQEGEYKYIPYQNLFRRAEPLFIEGHGEFEVYANRDSLKYQTIYGLENIKTLYRGTIRRAGFSEAWNVFVQLGMTDDSYVIKNSELLSNRDFLRTFLPFSSSETLEETTQRHLKLNENNKIWNKLLELDLFSSDKKSGLENATPAQILEHILKEKWTLQPHEKDRIVMYHKFGFEINGKNKQIESKMACIGENQTYTAMAKTVGLPMAMVALLILNGKISTYGVQLPTSKEVYEPILKELEDFGIVFQETEVDSN